MLCKPKIAVFNQNLPEKIDRYLDFICTNKNPDLRKKLNQSWFSLTKDSWVRWWKDRANIKASALKAAAEKNAKISKDKEPWSVYSRIGVKFFLLRF